MQRRGFKGVWIPASVWLDSDLTALDKFILAEIDSLDNERGCTAGNDYLAEFCGCSASKVSKSIAKLLELGYIERVAFDGRHRVLRSCIAKKAVQGSKKCQAPEQKMPAINIAINKDDYLPASNPVSYRNETKEPAGSSKALAFTGDEFGAVRIDPEQVASSIQRSISDMAAEVMRMGIGGMR